MATIDDGPQILVEAPEADDRAGPHGWVRIVLALVLGLLAGAVIALLLPREDGPRRAVRALPDPEVAAAPSPPVGGTTGQGDPAREGGPGAATDG